MYFHGEGVPTVSLGMATLLTGNILLSNFESLAIRVHIVHCVK